MDEIIKPIVNHVPENWRWTVSVGVLAFPYITRGLYSLYAGDGIVGFVRGILFGTNQKKEKNEKDSSNVPTSK